MGGIYHATFSILNIFLRPFSNRHKIGRKIEKVLVIKPDHYGDLLLSLPVIKSLSNKGYEVHVLAGSWSLPLIKNCPYIDKIFIFDHALLNRSQSFPLVLKNHLKNFFGIIRKLKKEKYDLVINLRQWYPNFDFFSFIVGARYRIGYNIGLSSLLDYTSDWNPEIYAIDNHYKLIEKCGIKIRKSERYGCVKHLLVKKSTKKYDIIINPIAGTSEKSWSQDNWLSLTKFYAAKCYRIALVGKGNFIAEPRRSEGSDELSVTLHINKITATASIDNLLNKTSIEKLVSIIKNSRTIIGPDSFIIHLATFLNKKAICIMSEKTEYAFYPKGAKIILPDALNKKHIQEVDWLDFALEGYL